MYEPQISVSGNLGQDPKLRTTPNGTSVVDLRIANTRRFQIGDEEWQDGETIWFDVACWKQLAEHVAESLSKGDRVTVIGKLIQRTWSREDGSDGTSLTIDASSVSVDLSRHPLRVIRPLRPGSASEALAAEHDPWTAPTSAAPAGEDEVAA